MKLFRQILFWSHLAAGLIAGLFIGVMSFTGVTLTFQDELVAWSERDARQITPSADGKRLSLDELQRKLREAQPEFRAAGVTLINSPSAAVSFSAGREGGFYLNPYTGEIRQPASTKIRDFMQTMLTWHRFLGRDGDQRPTGKTINGVCNIAFFVLASTGLYLWMPRSWSWRGVRAIALFNFNIAGKARDFNWHNVIGLWCATVLIVLTLTAIPISYRWGNDLIYRLVGEEPPVQQGPGAATTPAVEIKRPSPEARPLGYGVIVAQIQKDFPAWITLSLRSGGPNQRGPTAPAASAANKNISVSSATTAPPSARPEDTTRPGESDNSSRQENRRGEGNIARTPQPITVMVREAGAWPRTANTTLTLNPFTGEILKREGFADLSAGRQIRTWTRFLHTGQALGWPGQLAAGLACLGGCFLIYTGFALSWRRFFGRKIKSQGIPTGAN